MTPLAILKDLTYCILFKSDTNATDTSQFILKITCNYKNYILRFGDIYYNTYVHKGGPN